MPMKEAFLSASLSKWTRLLTGIVVQVCKGLELSASAKGQKSTLFPIARSEYLSCDVIAFSDNQKRWRFPTVIAKLENSNREDQIAYSLWKVLSIRSDLRLVFCYRNSHEKINSLLYHLRDEVIEAMGILRRVNLHGETIIVVESRNASDTFPYCYFAWWQLNKNTGNSEKF